MVCTLRLWRKCTIITARYQCHTSRPTLSVRTYVCMCSNISWYFCTLNIVTLVFYNNTMLCSCHGSWTDTRTLFTHQYLIHYSCFYSIIYFWNKYVFLIFFPVPNLVLVFSQLCLILLNSICGTGNIFLKLTIWVFNIRTTYFVDRFKLEGNMWRVRKTWDYTEVALIGKSIPTSLDAADFRYKIYTGSISFFF